MRPSHCEPATPAAAVAISTARPPCGWTTHRGELPTRQAVAPRLCIPRRPSDSLAPLAASRQSSDSHAGALGRTTRRCLHNRAAALGQRTKLLTVSLASGFAPRSSSTFTTASRPCRTAAASGALRNCAGKTLPKSHHHNNKLHRHVSPWSRLCWGIRPLVSLQFFRASAGCTRASHRVVIRPVGPGSRVEQTDYLGDIPVTGGLPQRLFPCGGCHGSGAHCWRRPSAAR